MTSPNLNNNQMLQEGIARSFDIIHQCQERNVNVKDLLTKITLSPNIEVKSCHSQEIREICSKPTKSRSLDDVLTIVRECKEFQSFVEFAPFLDEQELIVFCLCLKVRSLDKYEGLCRVRELPLEVFYILDGEIGVTNVSASNYTEDLLKDKIFHVERRGSTVGEASILYNSTR